MTESCPAKAAAAHIQAQAPGFRPYVSMVLGSGLGALADEVEAVAELRYGDIPGYPVTNVAGHDGKLILGNLCGVPVAMLRGRVHMYEGTDPLVLKTLIRSQKLLGADILYLTCAAASLSMSIEPGDIAGISDHVNLLGDSPLVGPNDDAFGPRFPSMFQAWAPELIALQRQAAQALGREDYHTGVYAAMLGPAFETAAEIRMLKKLGIDLCGMSTVPECIIARHCGLRVTGTAAITNFGEGLSNEELSHEHTLKFAEKATAVMRPMLVKFLELLADREPVHGK